MGWSLRNSLSCSSSLEYPSSTPIPTLLEIKDDVRKSEGEVGTGAGTGILPALTTPSVASESANSGGSSDASGWAAMGESPIMLGDAPGDLDCFPKPLGWESDNALFDDMWTLGERTAGGPPFPSSRPSSEGSPIEGLPARMLVAYYAIVGALIAVHHSGGQVYSLGFNRAEGVCSVCIVGGGPVAATTTTHHVFLLGTPVFGYASMGHPKKTAEK